MPAPESVEYHPQIPDFDFSQISEESLLLVRMVLLPCLGSGNLAQTLRLMMGLHEPRIIKMMVQLKEEFARRAAAEHGGLQVARIVTPGGVM